MHPQSQKFDYVKEVCQLDSDLWLSEQNEPIQVAFTKISIIFSRSSGDLQQATFLDNKCLIGLTYCRTFS